MAKVLRSSALIALGALVCAPLHAQTTVAGFTPGSFRVTEGGAASYSIPIQVPPGIAGMQPEIVLGYNSQGSGGMVGTGWGLGGLPVIHRCGRTILQDGVNTGVLYDWSDRYCLDGQRLVAVSGSYGADGTEYRTERESYSKITSHGSAGNGPAWFKLRTKSGQTLEFGNSDDSRIEAQGKSSVRLWALNKISDTAGNYLTVAYEEDNTNGDSRPSRIDYTGHGSPSVTPFASVQFFYDTRTDISPVYIGGSKVSVQKRLTNIKTYLNTTPVRDYRIAHEYAPNNGPSRATSITECDAANNCFSPITMSWNNPSGTHGFGAASWSASSYSAVAGDINGDGLADIATVQCAPQGEGDPIYCDVGYALNNGSGFGAVTSVTSFYSGFTVSMDANAVLLSLGDVNGDGKADLVVAGTLRFSNGGGFGSPVSISGNGLLGDVNGDGLADFVKISCTMGDPQVGPGACDVWVAMSNGSGFGSEAYQGSFVNYQGVSPNVAAPSLGDVNGDGRLDLNGGGSVRLSNGSGFDSATISSGTNGVLADVNGDGLADFATISCIYNEAQQTCSLGLKVSDGSQLLLTTAGADGGYSPRIAFGDFNGDGRVDAVMGGSVRFANAETPSTLASITGSLGATTSITYKPLTDSSVYAKDSDATWPVRDLREQGPLYVVSSVASSNGIGGSQTTNYFYRGAKAHLRGGGFLGFREFEATEASTGVKAITTFRQTHPFRGLASVVERRQASGTTISKTTNTWTDNPAVNALGYSFSTGIYHRSDLTTAVEESRELSGSLVVTVTTTTGYDAYGNATSVTVSTGDGYSKVTTNTYASPDTANWFLGRLTTSTVQATKP